MNEGSKQGQASCVLRLFGAPQIAVQEAAAAFPAGWKLTRIRAVSRGGETLVALAAEEKAGLDRAAQNLRTCFPADLYAQGETDLASCAVQTLEQHRKLLVCSGGAAGALIEPRLEAISEAEKVFDFGSQSYTHPETGPKLRALAERLAGKNAGDPVKDGVSLVQAAARLTGADLAAGCVEREGGALLLVGNRKGFWARLVWDSENPGLWLLDMIRRAAAGLPQAEGTRWQKYGAALGDEFYTLPEKPAQAPEEGAPAEKETPAQPPEGEEARPAEDSAQPEQTPDPEAWVPERNEPLPPAEPAQKPKKKGLWLHRLLVLVIFLVLLALLGLTAAWYFTGGDLMTLPELLGLKEFSRSGASLLYSFGGIPL